jgi:hypothetical protein
MKSTRFLVWRVHCLLRQPGYPDPWQGPQCCPKRRIKIPCQACRAIYYDFVNGWIRSALSRSRYLGGCSPWVLQWEFFLVACSLATEAAFGQFRVPAFWKFPSLTYSLTHSLTPNFSSMLLMPLYQRSSTTLHRLFRLTLERADGVSNDWVVQLYCPA